MDDNLIATNQECSTLRAEMCEIPEIESEYCKHRKTKECVVPCDIFVARYADMRGA